MNYYSKSEVWVAIYYRDNKNEHKQTVEISPTCSIAIQNTGEVLGIWVNE